MWNRARVARSASLPLDASASGGGTRQEGPGSKRRVGVPALCFPELHAASRSALAKGGQLNIANEQGARHPAPCRSGPVEARRPFLKMAGACPAAPRTCPFRPLLLDGRQVKNQRATTALQHQITNNAVLVGEVELKLILDREVLRRRSSVVVGRYGVPTVG